MPIRSIEKRINKSIILLFLILLPLIGISQEICTNSIDDDGDGLIDFNDTIDCNCNFTFQVNNIYNQICTPLRTFSAYTEIKSDKYQWYRNRIAMSNESDQILVLYKNHEGIYNLVMSNGTSCLISNDIIVDVPNYNFSISDTFCYGSSYSFAQRKLILPGIYYDSYIAANGCDSIVTLHLFGKDCGDTILVKDKNFKKELIKAGVDKNKDNKLQIAEAFLIDSLYIDQKNSPSNEVISDLRGLEAFKNLRHLTIKRADIHRVDANTLPKLEYIDVSNNIQYLSQITIDSCINLKYLDISNSMIDRIKLKNCINLETYINNASRIRDTIDFAFSPNLKKIDMQGNIASTVVKIDKNINLTEFYISSYPYNKLDLSSNPNLEIFQCNTCYNINSIDLTSCRNLRKLTMIYNKLDSVNLKNNELLEYVDLSSSEKLTTIDLSKKPNLKYVKINSSNKCTEFLIDNCPKLHYLNCLSCNFKSLDLSDSYVLDSLICGSLNYLNIKNGSIESYTDIWFDLWMKHLCVDEAQLNEFINKIHKNVAVNSYCSFEPIGISYNLHGKVQFDNNRDGCSTSDQILHNIRFFIENSQADGFLSTGTNDNYRILIPEGKNTIKPTIYNAELFNINPNFIEINLPKDSLLLNQNICISPKINKADISLHIIPLNDARPGTNLAYKLKINNDGSIPENGVFTLYKPKTLNFITSDISPLTIHNDSISWVLDNLKPFQSKEFLIIFKLNSPSDPNPVDIGDTILIKGVINNPNDINLNNNSHIIKQIVVNSFDPNDKICLEGNLLKQQNIGEFIHYLIRFENIGNANATNIVVRDSIDIGTLDINTVEIVDVSHMDVKLKTHSKYILEFIFENINLSYIDSLNDGYILFKVKLKNDLTFGDTIKNKAEIYFDFNKPIKTNEYSSTVDQNVVTATYKHEKQLYPIFPNPTDGNVNFTYSQNIKNLRLVNLTGKVVYNISDFEYGENLITFSTYNIPSGTYLLEVCDINNVFSFYKLIVK